MTEGAITNRRLAAILASDVVGYSRMMGADEAGTLAALKRHRDTIFNPAVAAHRGRVVKLIGDGTLVEFMSVVDAVNCALAIQRAVKAAAEPAGITLRIGVNLGDVIIEGDDIYGDGVNVAARLEPLADAGGVCIASIVNESIGNRVPVRFTDAGEVSVKNIDRPIRVWKWSPETDMPPPADARTPGPAAPTAKPADEPPSIAVLPFDNMSGDPEQEYFSDGITEDIITDLSKIAGLMVIARNSSFAYKKKSVDIRTVGRELGVRSVLEGSIRRAGNRVRINAQLIDANNGAHIWAERFDRDLTDIFAVQDEVTRDIVAALKVKLTPAEAARISDAPEVVNIEAHDLFLRGRALATSTNINREIFLDAVRLLRRALEIEPNLSQAYAGLSLTYMFNHFNRWTEDSADALKNAAEYAAKAVALGPNDSFSHVAAGVVAGSQGNLEKANAELELALELNPNDPFAISNHANFTLFAGYPEKAIPEIERAMRVDPGFSQQYVHWLGLAHLLLGHYETAAMLFRERIRLVPKTDASRAALVSALGHLGEVEEARAVWAELMSVNPGYVAAERIGRLPFASPAHRQIIFDGIAKAGLQG